MHKILTIAGSDSGGGSGIQADLKTIQSLGGYGMSVVTALTAQNTVGIKSIVPVDPDFVALQMDAVLEDIGADCIKIGMLANAAIVRVVAEKIAKHHIEKVVIDPVMSSTNGNILLDEKGREALVRELFPLGYVVTPNIPESEILTKKKIGGVPDMKKAARRIRKMGPKNVLIKGGHLEEAPIDILHDGYQDYEFYSQRAVTRHTHGTGCTLASALATFLAQGLPLMESIDKAKRYLYRALRFSLPLGRGIGPANHYASIAREIARTRSDRRIGQSARAIETFKCRASHTGSPIQPGLCNTLCRIRGRCRLISGQNNPNAEFGGCFRLGSLRSFATDTSFGSRSHGI